MRLTAKEHLDEVLSLITRLQVQLEAIESARCTLTTTLRSIADQCVCRCAEDYTSRGRHGPGCLEHLRVEALEALGVLP